MLAEMATANGPGIMLGDFNTTDQSDLYKLVQDTGLTDAFRAVGWGFGLTWPVHFGRANTPPLVRIDYIWFTKHFGAVDAWVGPQTGADHLPVLAELTWRE
jgi:endonuclease/exonuclease/phosphatase (EEP) superfamily protein YafD